MLIEKIKLEEDEKILKMTRRHWFIITVEAVGVLLIAVVPIGLVFFLIASGMFDTLVQITIPMHVLVFLSAFWLLIAWMLFFRIWTNYYLDLWTITNRRIIAIDQKGFFHRSISSFRYERLQDINIEINGIIATFLNFGTLQAETAGHEGKTDFMFYSMPAPREVKALILEAADDLTHDYRRRGGMTSDGV